LDEALKHLQKVAVELEEEEQPDRPEFTAGLRTLHATKGSCTDERTERRGTGLWEVLKCPFELPISELWLLTRRIWSPGQLHHSIIEIAFCSSARPALIEVFDLVIVAIRRMVFARA